MPAFIVKADKPRNIRRHLNIFFHQYYCSFITKLFLKFAQLMNDILPCSEGASICFVFPRKNGVFDVSCGIHASKSWVMGAPIR